MGIPKVKLSFQVFAHLQGKPFTTELFPQLQVDWITLVTKGDSMVARSVGRMGLTPWIYGCLTVRKVWLLEASGTFEEGVTQTHRCCWQRLWMWLHGLNTLSKSDLRFWEQSPGITHRCLPALFLLHSINQQNVQTDLPYFVWNHRLFQKLQGTQHQTHLFWGFTTQEPEWIPTSFLYSPRITLKKQKNWA